MVPIAIDGAKAAELVLVGGLGANRAEMVMVAQDGANRAESVWYA